MTKWTETNWKLVEKEHLQLTLNLNPFNENKLMFGTMLGRKYILFAVK